MAFARTYQHAAAKGTRCDMQRKRWMLGCFFALSSDSRCRFMADYFLPTVYTAKSTLTTYQTGRELPVLNLVTPRLQQLQIATPNSNSNHEALDKLVVASSLWRSFCCIGCHCLHFPRRRMAKYLETSHPVTRTGKTGLRTTIRCSTIPWLGGCERKHIFLYQQIWWESEFIVPGLAER